MASIIASTYFVSVQRDGRMQVTETHTDNAGGSHTISYLAEAGTDLDTSLSAHAAQLASDLAATEIAANVQGVVTRGSLFTPQFIFSDLPQNAAALRDAYRAATQVEAVMIGDYLAMLPDDVIVAMTGITSETMADLRANKLALAATIAEAIRNAAGQ